jgi:hypothetical protein
MMGKYVKIMLQVLVAYVIFSILSQYFETYILVIVLLLIIVLFVLFGNRKKDKNLYFLEKECDVEKYLEFVNEKLKDKDQSIYLLYLSYGNLYNGNFDTIEDDINKIDATKFKAKELLIYEEIKLKLLYNNKDIEVYENKWDEISEGSFGNMYYNELMVLKAPLHLMKEEYTELVDLMYDLIPKQRQAYRIIELEYYLSVAYIAQGKDDDAVAVLEFVTKRDFKLDHVTKGQGLLDKLSSD